MTKIILNIKECDTCPFHTATPYPTNDSFKRPSYWWCNHPDMRQEEKNDAGGYAKKIAGYVEWNDKTPIPDWCPIADHSDLHAGEEPSDKEYVARIPNVPSSFFATEDEEGEIEYLERISKDKPNVGDPNEDQDYDKWKGSPAN